MITEGFSWVARPYGGHAFRSRLAIALIGAVMLFSAIDAAAESSMAHEDAAKAAAQDTLIVWAGDKAHVKPDFLAVVDFDEKSSSYGKVLQTVPLPALLGAGAIGNEPHHLGVSADGKTLALGGLLSVLRGQDQVFFYDVSEPRNPQFIRSDNPPGASITDEFDSLKNGGFLGTFMGSPDGANPGRLVEYDANQHFVQAWPLNPPTDGFDPHGLAIDQAHNLILTSDYICPLHSLNIPGGGAVLLRGSIRVWNFKKRSITRKIVVGDPNNPPGTMDVKLIPHDPHLRGFTAGMLDNKLYLINPKAGAATPVYDFSAFAVPNASIWPQLIWITRNGDRMFVTLNYAGKAGKIVQLNIANPRRPKLLDVVDLGANSGPHYLTMTKDEKRLVVSDYFLVEDLAPGGVVQADGDHKVHVIDVTRNHMTLDPHFDLDFNRDIGTGPARPHGMAVLRARARN